MVRPTINSEKHIVQQTLTTVDAGTIFVTNIVAADENPQFPHQVRIGAIVKAVYVELWYVGSSSQPVIQTSTLEKVVGDGTFMTQPEAQLLDEYRNKKNILYSTQGIVGDANTNPTPLMRGWFKIPKGKQRIGQGDRIVINVAALGEASNDLEICGLFIFKEYF